MIEGQYAQQGATSFDNRDSRERRDEYPTNNQATYAHLQPTSPPPSASPFAFAPPPLSSTTNSNRPIAAMHSEAASTTQEYPYYQQRSQPPPPPPAGGGGGNGTGGSYPAYTGSHPMGYRAVSGETNRAPPPAPLSRIPSFSVMSQTSGVGSQASPTSTSPYYPPPRAAGQPYGSAQHSPRGTGAYPTPGYYSAPPYGQPQALEMPRSLSYPNSYSAPPYGSYLPSVSTPTLVGHNGELPPLMRHGSTNSIGTVSSQAPAMGYSFANRLPLVDRPFKCDQCVQSFNRNHDLKRHKRIHLSVKPFGCEKCGKTFSRKDALRRHWMVRGCRGEEGATAPITPTFNLNGPPPALSPPTPPSGNGNSNNNNSSSNENGSSNNSGSSNSYGNQPLSFNHPSAPPPLSTLPPRQSSDQPSQIILTPNDAAQSRQSGNSDNSESNGLGEPVVIDPALSGLDSARDSNNSMGDVSDNNYFDVMRKGGNVPDSATSSTFSRYGASPKDDMRHHPYRRALPSPSTHSGQPPLGPDGKPMFNLPPFSQGGPGPLLAPIGSEGMSKENSTDSSDPAQWPRWNRPAYPFPSPGSGRT